MQLIKVGAAVLNQTPLDWDNNRAHILQAIEAAKAVNVTILCLPEMCITGYGCEDAYHAPGLIETAWTILQEILPATKGLIVSLGLPLIFNNGIFNTVCLIVGGGIAGFAAKRFLAGDGIHYEPRWFKPWPGGVHTMARIHDRDYPLGDLHFDVGGIKLGFEICEDAWVAGRPGGNLSLKGVDVILNPSASHFAFGKWETRKRFVLEGSRAFGVTYLYANLLGNESGRAIYDGGALIASAGKLMAVGERFSYADFQVNTAVVDIDVTRMNQARTSSFRPEVDGDEKDCVRVDFTYPRIKAVAPSVQTATWESSPQIKEEEFARAVSLSLYDYMRKSRSNGFVVSLSGGADSAAVVTLIHLMVAFGIQDLGRDAFWAKLAYLPPLTQADSPGTIVHALLATVYQATANSGEVTRNAARVVAEAIGADHLEFDVDALVNGYIGMVGNALGRPITWQTDDFALQNIQARGRAPGVWMLANIRNGLLLATSNRSEAAVGYATMDGDTCGGLSPIAGIDKAFLRQWLRWMESTGPDGLAPIPELTVINKQQPTAELRPKEYEQTDESDLMPYDLLDAIEKAAIRDKKMPLEVLELMESRFPQWNQAQLGLWIERFFKLWCRNQWKRERYAPSFHLDDANLDPKTWCRFPILSGGFERELAEMRAFIATP
ncbi:MAG: NAD(+) synthase [Candidatus Sericytochromatia bacterium]|nr:NAD(+) synthase [Candidatus Sericytochromatia bacterium]